MERYVVFYVNRIVKSYNNVDDAISCAKKMRKDYTFVDVIDSYTGEIVYTWVY